MNDEDPQGTGALDQHARERYAADKTEPKLHRLSDRLPELRADALHRYLCTPQGAIELVGDIWRLRELDGWSLEAITTAIDDLVTSGALSENATGRVVVKPWLPPA